MTDLQLIEKLERHIGFVFHRLNCDGNYYADVIDGGKLHEARAILIDGCIKMRHALKPPKFVVTAEGVVPNTTLLVDIDQEVRSIEMVNSFDMEEYEHEREEWE